MRTLAVLAALPAALLAVAGCTPAITAPPPAKRLKGG
jgi:hypothetical protein